MTCSVCRSVGWSVCRNFLSGRQVTLILCRFNQDEDPDVDTVNDRETAVDDFDNADKVDFGKAEKKTGKTSK